MCRHHPHLHRRAALALLAGAPFLAACKAEAKGPEDIRWNRETCEICGMIISDPAYAAEVRGGPDMRLAKFDDIGDAVHWLELQPWKAEPAVEFWVRNADTAADWMDARTSYYRGGVVSPMDYGYAAIPGWEPGAVDFAAMVAAVLEKGLSSRCLPLEGETG
jgi:nitrous oxide reductase accessory protein NosL